VRVYEAFETSKRLTDEGRECEIEFGGRVIATVKVRPADAALNADYRRELAELSIGLKGNGLDAIDDDLDRELLWKIYARTVIAGWTWSDPADKKDPKLKFNEENAIALFRRTPKFFQGIQRVALQWSHFRAEHEEEAAGN
jgi:hypothetical protein